MFTLVTVFRTVESRLSLINIDHRVRRVPLGVSDHRPHVLEGTTKSNVHTLLMETSYLKEEKDHCLRS